MIGTAEETAAEIRLRSGSRSPISRDYRRSLVRPRSGHKLLRQEGVECCFLGVASDVSSVRSQPRE